MLQVLLLACILAVGATDPQPEVQPEAAANPVFVHHDHERYDRHRDHVRHGDWHEHHHGHDDHAHGPKKAHVSDEVLEKQYKIIEHVYSPDYYEPTLVLDYRYLKTGGRDYVRGPGGQILILPHGVRSPEHNDHKDFDSLLEFLRLRHQAQMEAQMQRMEDDHRHHHHADLRRDDHKHVHEHNHGHGHGQTHGHGHNHGHGHEHNHRHEHNHGHSHGRGPELRTWA